MPEKFNQKKLNEGLEYPTENEAGFDGLVSGESPDQETEGVIIESKKSRETIELPSRKEHPYLKDGIEEWFKCVDNYILAMKKDGSVISQKLEGLEKRVFDQIELGKSMILHQDPKDISQMYGRNYENFIKKAAEYHEQYGQEFPSVDEFDQEKILFDIIKDFRFQTTPYNLSELSERVLEWTKDNTETAELNPFIILNPFEDQISIIEAMPEGEEKEKQIKELLEEALLAGHSTAYRDIPQRWAIFSEKNLEYWKKIEKFCKSKNIKEPLYPPIGSNFDIFYQYRAAELYNQLNPPKYFVKKIEEKFDNDLVQEITDFYLLWSGLPATLELRGRTAGGGYPEVIEMRKNGKLDKNLPGFTPFEKFHPSIEINGEITNLKNVDQLFVLLIEALKRAFPSALIDSVLNLDPGKILVEKFSQNNSLKITYKLDPTGKFEEKYPTSRLAEHLAAYGGLITNWTISTEEDKKNGVGYFYLEHKD